MYKVVVTEPAQQDLKEAVSYISNELKNKQAAYKLVDMVEEAVVSLQSMPERYAIVDDEILAMEGFRFITIKNYLLFYVVRNETKTVVIQRFLYARRDWLNLLKLDKLNNIEN
jgi:toxin ParE1/3/4